MTAILRKALLRCLTVFQLVATAIWGTGSRVEDASTTIKDVAGVAPPCRRRPMQTPEAATLQSQKPGPAFATRPPSIAHWLLPILAWLPGYRRDWLLLDVLAGPAV